MSEYGLAQTAKKLQLKTAYQRPTKKVLETIIEMQLEMPANNQGRNVSYDHAVTEVALLQDYAARMLSLEEEKSEKLQEADALVQARVRAENPALYDEINLRKSEIRELERRPENSPELVYLSLRKMNTEVKKPLGVRIYERIEQSLPEVMRAAASKLLGDTNYQSKRFAHQANREATNKQVKNLEEQIDQVAIELNKRADEIMFEDDQVRKMYEQAATIEEEYENYRLCMREKLADLSVMRMSSVKIASLPKAA